jgi:hypothetical protein
MKHTAYKKAQSQRKCNEESHTKDINSKKSSKGWTQDVAKANGCIAKRDLL